MKDKIQSIINKMDAITIYRQGLVMIPAEALDELRALIKEDKWEPKQYEFNWYFRSDGKVKSYSGSEEKARQFGNEWPTEELAIKARDMNKRNQLIMQAKHEMGYGDGNYAIFKNSGRWRGGVASPQNTEITFENRSQTETVINMLELNNETTTSR